jgi:hypothetical protein
MSTIVCDASRCPNRSSAGFCKKDIIILNSHESVMQCRTGLIDIYERDEKELMEKNGESNRNKEN